MFEAVPGLDDRLSQLHGLAIRPSCSESSVTTSLAARLLSTLDGFGLDKSHLIRIFAVIEFKKPLQRKVTSFIGTEEFNQRVSCTVIVAKVLVKFGRRSV